MRGFQYSAYTAPSIILAFLFSPMGVLQGIYAKYFGVTLTTIAIVLLISRLFDAVTDPLIGYWSDHCYAKSGSRKSFVIGGGLLFGISSYFLYVPVDPHQLNDATTVSTSYFLGWLLIFYLAWTLVEIPHLAWGAVLAPSAKEKNKLFSFRALATYLGFLLFFLVPFLPVFPDNNFTPQTLQWAAVAAGVILIPVLYLCVKFTPDGKKIPRQRYEEERFWELRNEILGNKPFLAFIVAFALYGMGAVGMFYTLSFIFIDTYLDLGEHYALLSLIGISSGLFSVGIWCWMANHLGKKNSWCLGVLLYIVSVLGLGFFEPGKTSIIALAAVMLFSYTGAASIVSLSPSILSDIIDFNTWKFGTDRAATYFSVYTFVLKTSTAIGGSISFGIAGYYGFDPSVIEHTEEAVFGLRLAACWLSSVLMLLSILVMSLVPVDAYRHSIIRRRLDERAARQSRCCNS